MSLLSSLSFEERLVVAAVFGTNLTDMERIAFGLAAKRDLQFWGGKTLKTFSGKRFVFNDEGELCRVQEMYDGKTWLTVARSDWSSAED